MLSDETIQTVLNTHKNKIRHLSQYLSWMKCWNEVRVEFQIKYTTSSQSPYILQGRGNDMVDTSSLNINQLSAVSWENGPLLVLAGPGSGKTRVLTYRIARIIEESAGENFRILGLTFTNKAAREMQKRVNALVPNVDERINLTTYHSFSAQLLRQHGHLFSDKRGGSGQLCT